MKEAAVVRGSSVSPQGHGHSYPSAGLLVAGGGCIPPAYVWSWRRGTPAEDGPKVNEPEPI